ncbi:hypothetical protein P7K49_020962, partial [Saguinus oedipus]
TICLGQSQPLPPPHPSERATKGHSGVGREVNPSAASSLHLEEGHAGHPRESGSYSYLVGSKPAASPPGRALELGVEFRGGTRSRAKPGGCDPRLPRPHPPGQEPQVSKEPPLPQQPALRARCGAVWGGRGPERPEPTGKEAGERNEPPPPAPPSSKPAAHQL